VTANGKDAVLINIARQPSKQHCRRGRRCGGADCGTEAQAACDVPPRAVFTISLRIVRDSIASVRDAIFIGLVLACIVLFLFLRD